MKTLSLYIAVHAMMIGLGEASRFTGFFRSQQSATRFVENNNIVATTATPHTIKAGLRISEKDIQEMEQRLGLYMF